MKQLVLLHGMGATSKDQWLPFIKNHFEQADWQVIAPDIPDSGNPDLESWVAYVSKLLILTPETVLVGHSAGCPFIVSLLERSEIKIAKAILVAGFIEVIIDEVTPLIQDSYDWTKIKDNCEQFFFVNSDNDPYKCDDAQGRILLNKLGGTQIIMAGERHFGTEEFNQPYPEFPFLIKLIED